MRGALRRVSSSILFTLSGLFELNALYAAFLLEKINFHRLHTEFQGDFNQEKFVQKHSGMSSERSQLAVTHMLDLQQCIYKLQRAILDVKVVDDCRAAALIPLVVESYNLYMLETYLIRKLVEGGGFLLLKLKPRMRWTSSRLSLRSFTRSTSRSGRSTLMRATSRA